MILPTDAATTTRRSSLGGTFAARMGLPLVAADVRSQPACFERHVIKRPVSVKGIGLATDYRCTPCEQQDQKTDQKTVPSGTSLPPSAASAGRHPSGQRLRTPPRPPPAPPGGRTSRA